MQDPKQPGLSHELIMTALEAAASAIVITKRDGKILWVNNAFTQLSGHTKEEALGKTPKIQNSGRHKPEFFRNLWKTILAGRVWRAETYNKRKDGSDYVEEQTITPVWGEKGEVEYFISIKQDVTKKKDDEEALKQYCRELSVAKLQAERQSAYLSAQAEELARARNEALAAIQTKSLFLANISHELRTPLTAIIGFAETMLEEGLSPREQEKVLQTIARNGQHLLQLINDILDISKIEAGKLAVERVDCSPLQILNDIHTLLLPKAQAKRLSFTIEYCYPLPKLIKSDPTRLKQILFNLIGNAIKFTETGWIKVVLSADIPNQTLRFAVKDSGIGIDSARQSKLFASFTQADDSITRRFGGTGLGLAISKELCSKLGGDLTCESAEGKGSTFTCSVGTGDIDAKQLLYAYPALLNLEASSVPQLAVKPARLKGSILLADDMPDNQALVSFLIRKLGSSVSVRCVQDGEAAVKEALTKHFDLILMDMHMPVMDGFMAVQALRSNGYDKPVVALTADAADESAHKCLSAGCDDYLAKPFERRNFYSILSKYLPQETLSPEVVHAEFLEENSALASIVLSFVNSLPHRMEEIETALREENLESVRALSHKLQSAGLFGYPTLSESAAEVNRAALARDQEGARQAFGKLKNLGDRIAAGRGRLSELADGGI